MDVIGGGILIAVAAALWIAYLLPSWLRRRQYLATERNAVRLQQTLRILAETAETPEPIVVEATAREVATQQRILHEHEETARLAAEAAEQTAIAERRAAEEAAEAARARAAASAPVTQPIPAVAASQIDPSHDAARRARRAVRRRRAACTLIALAGLITVIVGLVAAAFGASLVIAAAGGVAFVGAAFGLVRLAKRRLPQVAVAAPATPAALDFEPIEFAEPTAETEGWTPRPLPKPLHLSRGTIAATAMASIEAAAELKRVESEALLARRAERLAPPVPKISPAASAAERAAAGEREAERAADRTAQAAPNPYARMGIVDDARPGIDDLDAVLRRRRAAG
ncbi:hypothetical protein [Agromyces sp. S2-1-8]|uniref:hypothetical protein n=1 Tax=Agromyces sp. S2-1-8 TaxID=2897180 RepID=UPI001E41D63F|nr:hypothetical protein [Agromyces sp. S2-1-8]MCD5346464.1 hypothetical protein [Agromyces sp. S2-1-8]